MNEARIAGRSKTDWQRTHPLLKSIEASEEVFWLNPKTQSSPPAMNLSRDDVKDASNRLERFAPFIADVFPQTAADGGLIESPLTEIKATRKALDRWRGSKLPGRLFLKRDDLLPISGSIKARGGFYEVLKQAETLARAAGLLKKEDNYQKLALPSLREFFSKHSIIVGSTGNLGLSIGIMSAKLRFKVTVHMSADAKQWKKDLLAKNGVSVVEHDGDYGMAVSQGRYQAETTANSHFIDDENSKDLFLGYCVAALRLEAQLKAQSVEVSENNPLAVYLPCGVGGGPGGIAFGLKQVFGDNVFCFFAEPVQSACMLLGMYSGLHDKVSVRDFGLNNSTCADGLAVGRASGFVGKVMEPLLDGIYTIRDPNFLRMLKLIKDSENIKLEPSATAGLYGPHWATSHPELGPKLQSATHIAWATGGGMVPQEEYNAYYRAGAELT